MASIPLLCNICPKKPRFSDVSHLLTHIASKGHLSHYYRIKVRSGTEEDCRSMIEAYDQWYAQHKVEDLMSERMNLKDKRRTRALRNQVVPSRNASPINRGKPVPHRKDSMTMSRDGSMDPRLGEPRIRDPRMSMSAQILNPTHIPPNPNGLHLQHTPGHPNQQPHFSRSHYPSLPQHHHYPQPYNPYSHMGTPTQPGSQPHSRPYVPCMVPGGINQDFDHPYKRRRSDIYDDRESETVSSRSMSVLDSVGFDSLDGFGEEAPECAKLKGVYWPGMDIFDSATPEMKRKRNQKKDISVIEQLEANSLEVEPTEMIFTPLGTLKKERKISGNPEDDETSPIRGESSPTYNYSTFSRSTGAPVSFDTSRFGPNTSHQLGSSQIDPARTLLRPLLGDRSEMMDLYGQSKRKRPFDMFHEREVSLHSPAGFGLLNAEFHLPGHPGSASTPSRTDHGRYDLKDPSNNCNPFDNNQSGQIDTPNEKEASSTLNVPPSGPGKYQQSFSQPNLQMDQGYSHSFMYNGSESTTPLSFRYTPSSFLQQQPTSSSAPNLLSFKSIEHPNDKSTSIEHTSGAEVC